MEPSERMQRNVGHRVAEAWGGLFVAGLFLCALGILAMLASAATGLLSSFVIGLVLIASGILEGVGSFTHREKTGSRVLGVLSGVLVAVIGVILIARPELGVMAAGLLIATWFVASGLFRSVTSLVDRYPRWGWDFAYGILALILGLILFGRWPLSSFFIVGLLIGLEILARGIVLIATSMAVREEAHAAA